MSLEDLTHAFYNIMGHISAEQKYSDDLAESVTQHATALDQAQIFVLALSDNVGHGRDKAAAETRQEMKDMYMRIGSERDEAVAHNINQVNLDFRKLYNEMNAEQASTSTTRCTS